MACLVRLPWDAIFFSDNLLKQSEILHKKLTVENLVRKLFFFSFFQPPYLWKTCLEAFLQLFLFFFFKNNLFLYNKDWFSMKYCSDLPWCNACYSTQLFCSWIWINHHFFRNFRINICRKIMARITFNTCIYSLNQWVSEYRLVLPMFKPCFWIMNIEQVFPKDTTFGFI